MSEDTEGIFWRKAFEEEQQRADKLRMENEELKSMITTPPKVLHLTLKKKWFDMTDSGEKPEEYREITPYWISRLMQAYPGNIGGDYMDEHRCIAYLFKKFDHVFARNGYSPKKNPSWLREWKGTSVGYGQEKWGAEPGKKYFVIKLGEKIKG